MKDKTPLRGVEIRKLGSNKGTPRLWIEGGQASRAGFQPGMKISVTLDEKRCMLTLEANEQGTRVVSKKVVGDREVPVIDIQNESLLGIFVRMGLAAVRIVIQMRRIFVLPIASEVRAKERLDRLREKLNGDEPLLMGSFSSGIGILDRAAHTGLAEAGIRSRLAIANEIREDCMEHALAHNPVFDAETVLLTAPMQEVVFDAWVMSQLPTLDGLVIGIPCSGASNAGRTKRKLTLPESHPDVGHLVVPFLAAVAHTSPAFVVIECVPGWLNTASAAIARSMLRDLGYVIHETVLNAADWNMLEHRERMCIVAVTHGIEFSFDLVERPELRTRKLGEVMDIVAHDDKCWSPLLYLKAKQERDAAEGKGFKMTIVNDESTRVPTLNKTLAKRQSTGTFLQHPTNPDLLRIPTVREHARCKGIWEDLVEGVTQTFGHEICGQAVSVPPFISVFNALGRSMQAFKKAAAVTFSAFVRGETVSA
ncbi:DNA cytosine methyltransferase [Burkholderia cepacia]|uniref:DNA cytosine methyltransferase n=2 Tax=Burkholderia TaxID=32008 RepID=UPI001068360E|nr:MULTISPECIES: DNA cytosine methyltransferase [Burkholderia cepacia complex]MCA7889924.1 DNA cytosine methyltransferase [Burkholderia contaminans]TES64748.1 DNA cytosine methyltransferase [Burkholderia cepacia]